MHFIVIMHMHCLMFEVYIYIFITYIIHVRFVRKPLHQASSMLRSLKYALLTYRETKKKQYRNTTVEKKERLHRVNGKGDAWFATHVHRTHTICNAIDLTSSHTDMPHVYLASPHTHTQLAHFDMYSNACITCIA